MRDSVSSEVTLGLVVGHPRVLTTFGLGLFGSRLRLGFQRRHGFPYLLQPTLSKGQLLRQLISTLVFAVPPVFLIIRCLGLSQQLRYLRRQLRCLLLHPLVTHRLIPNPPKDRDGRREDSGRGEGVTGAMIRARIWVDGRLAGGLQALLGAPMAAYSVCGERDGGIGHGKRRSRTGLARVCGDVGLAGGSVADGRRQAGSGMARSRARARLNCSSQGRVAGEDAGSIGVPSG